MKIVSVHGIDHSLLSPSKHVRFIPSIAKWRETGTHVMYLVSYRVWKPETEPKSPVRKTNDPGHPWVTFWKMSRFDGTAFLLLEVSKKDPSSGVRVVREFPVTRNGRVDMRLYPSPSRANEFLVTFNTFGLLNPRTYPKNYGSSKDSDFQPTCFLYKNTKATVFKDATAKPAVRAIDSNKRLSAQQKRQYKDQSWCTFQMKAVMRYNESTGKFDFRDTGLVCPEHHNRFEKNMQIYVHEKTNKVGYQYAITPWRFFEPETCEVVAPHKDTTLFSRLAKHFDPRPGIEDMARNVAFSCSTPLIDYTRSEYLAVGHFKIHHGARFGNKRNINAFLKTTARMLGVDSFTYNDYKDRLHPKLIYGMFFYTVDKKTLQLKKASGGFVPLYKDYAQALSFPTGLSRHTKNHFLVSYHENDMTMRLLSLSRDEIDQTLVFDNKSRVSDYTFQYAY